ncbi:hypothetical protein [Novosphingobium sp.]|uniref:hypothetical protein n=1 Tax=Novosphingobium sp. TaxID=1874826 RepID=UPI0025D17F94|nr:hypothetical protein [Novosphingobium sp.]
MQLDPRADQAMLERASRPARPRAWMPLLSALLRLGEGGAELVSHAERAWASVTFSGSRHTVRFTFTGLEAIEAGERFIDALPEHEFAIPRQLVADAAIVSVIHTALPQPMLEVEVELLLLDES